MDEADITINCVKLTEAQAMTVRVALNNFWFDVKQGRLGDDEIGKDIAEGYINRISEITQISKTRQLIQENSGV